MTSRKRKGVNFSREFRVSSAKLQLHFHDSTVTSSRANLDAFVLQHGGLKSSGKASFSKMAPDPFTPG
jgi:hypothetical protein